MNRFIKALEAQYQAKIEEALAVIDLYLNKAVGVGEHPDIMAVLDEHITILESNKSKLETLKSLFSPLPENTVEKQSDK
jgi:hypothetical protein|tara:strand:+ start:1635 stop:1871 length:237 start_codon:yes stop_codon:yes gene_type:complete